MSPAADEPELMPTAPRHRRRLHVLAGTLLFRLAAWLVLAYVVAPLGWRRYEKRHPALNNAPRITHTATGIPGDPINLGLVAMEDDLHRALLSADWSPADPITLKSSLRIAEATVLRRSY